MPLLGRKLPKKAKNRQIDEFCNRIIRPSLFSTVKHALNTIRVLYEYAVSQIPAKY